MKVGISKILTFVKREITFKIFGNVTLKPLANNFEKT